ncbi:LysR family transcriptional regulator [Frigidibacter albus]|uniref:LysR family transcriptional regulator n=2 Tax=Frigidibacter albus TaxID=1465486 RepID=A0A6L8VLE0_9RHOB|nr:LysR family transcriptional regulator [Frigidibacter albus]NBE32753.1 LysR family transcriptional regulator [Frigidibacter albus]GGH60740.1 LysR family transcriptional regulator [Frigidibacter albus]
MITLRQLSYLTALAEEAHFGRAAARVHVTQPALSMQIRELEGALGLTLVDRLPRGVRLTRAGHEVLARAGRILAEVREMESAARRGALGGVVTLGVIPTLAPYLVPPALAALRSATDLPQDLRLREADTETLLRELSDGTLDAAVIATPPGPGMTQLPLFEDRFLLAGTAARLAALAGQAEALRPVSLDPDQLLLLDEGHCLTDQALEVCALDRRRMGGGRARIDLGASSLATLCGLVAAGMGLTFVPEAAARAESAAAPQMALMRFAAPEPSRQVRLVRRAAIGEEPWVPALARLLAGAGAGLLAEAQRLVPRG